MTYITLHHADISSMLERPKADRRRSIFFQLLVVRQDYCTVSQLADARVPRLVLYSVRTNSGESGRLKSNG